MNCKSMHRWSNLIDRAWLPNHFNWTVDKFIQQVYISSDTGVWPVHSNEIGPASSVPGFCSKGEGKQLPFLLSAVKEYTVTETA